MDAVADADVNSKNNYVSADDGVVRLLVVLLWVFVVQGTTALDYAKHYKHTQIVQLLMK